MSTRTARCRLCAVAVLLPAALSAQDTVSLRKDALVRIVLPATSGQREQVVYGRFVALRHDTVTIATGGGLDVGGGIVPATETSYGLDGGRQLQTLVEGRGYGVAGALLGAFLGYVVAASAVGSHYPDATGDEQTVGGVLGAIPGALIGAAVGSAIRSGRWVPVPVPGLHLAFGPHRLALQLRL